MDIIRPRILHALERGHMDKIINNIRMLQSERNIHSFGVVVHQNGKDREYRFYADDRECIYSGSKTFTSMAVGIAQAEGLLSIQDKLLDYFPEFKDKASEGSENIKLVDLLHMSSGKGETYAGRSAAMNRDPKLQQVDWLEYFLASPMKYSPGANFHYDNLCTYSLGRVIEKVSGSKLRDYLMPRLFIPMEIYNPMWGECPGGHTLSATQLYLTTSEFHKLGVLMLNGGMYNGIRLVNEEYINIAATDTVKTWGDRYGYQLWRCGDTEAYRADGLYGQYSIVFPDKQTVVTLTGHNEGDGGAVIQSILDSVYN